MGPDDLRALEREYMIREQLAAAFDEELLRAMRRPAPAGSSSV